jgi:Ca2+/Na+ antiporter
LIAAHFLRRQSPRSGFLFFYLTVFLFSLVGGLWLSPLGPPLGGVYWLPFIAVGTLGAYILYLKAPRKPPENREETLETLDRIEKERNLEILTYLTFDVVFWIILLILIVAVIVRYATFLT